MAWTALTRAVSPRIGDCELTHLERVPIDPRRAAEEHRGYEAALRSLGCRVVRLPDAPGFPDGVFVEDTAVVLDEVAVMARPGAESRRGEVDSVERVVAGHRPVRRIDPPGTLDGGDVLVVGRDVLAGASQRTNDAGAAMLRAHLAPFGYAVRQVPVRGCLHLKSAVTAVADGLVLLNPEWVDPGAFEDLSWLEVHPSEPRAANVLRVGDTLLAAEDCPRTNARLRAEGLRVETVTVSELALAEAGVTCCSLVFRTEEAG